MTVVVAQNTVSTLHYTTDYNDMTMTHSAGELCAQHITLAQTCIEQIAAHRTEVHQRAKKDKTVPDGVRKRYHSVTFEEHDAKDVDSATDGHFMHPRMLALPINQQTH